nr:imidazole glycerol phosphate synthase hisHF, chloroplastic [Ipomoea batatas]
MEAAAFTSASQLGIAGKFSSSSSSSAGSRFLRFLQNKPNSIDLNFKASRSSIRASATGEEDSVVTLLDYGAGNVRNLRNAIRFLGFDVKDVQTPEDILKAKHLIFPGVGDFATAMDVLNKKGMAEAFCTYIEHDRPFLGICLGMQLLFESSEENGPVKGLGFIPGVVGCFD